MDAMAITTPTCANSITDYEHVATHNVFYNHCLKTVLNLKSTYCFCAHMHEILNYFLFTENQ